MNRYTVTPRARADIEEIWTYMLFYRMTNDGIEVVRILHRRMDIERHIGADE